MLYAWNILPPCLESISSN